MSRQILLENYNKAKNDLSMFDQQAALFNLAKNRLLIYLGQTYCEVVHKQFFEDMINQNDISFTYVRGNHMAYIWNSNIVKPDLLGIENQWKKIKEDEEKQKLPTFDIGEFIEGDLDLTQNLQYKNVFNKPTYYNEVFTEEECNSILNTFLVEDENDEKQTDLKLLIPIVDFKLKYAELYNKICKIIPECNKIILRKVVPSNKFIPLHLDVSKKTLQIFLTTNTEDEKGLTYYFLGKRFQCFTRVVGCGSLHDNTIYHGVSQLKSGIRYSLFFLCE
jgi:hypothetical protein